MAKQKYTLTAQDIIAFVQQLPEGARIGSGLSTEECLGASTLAWKYAEEIAEQDISFTCGISVFTVHPKEDRLDVEGDTVIRFLSDYGVIFNNGATKEEVLASGILGYLPE